MAIYVYECNKCLFLVEKIQPMGGETPNCPDCGTAMRKKVTYPVMVKVKGSGGYPSRRKMIQGTAPYCRG